MKTKKTVGQIIREKRKEIHCSQEAIAEALGVSIKFISLVENGERQLSVTHFTELSKFLDIPVKTLFESKLQEDKTHDSLRKIKKDLEGGGNQVKNAIEMNRIRDFRVREIEELIKFLKFQRQHYICQIKTGTIEKQRVESQIALLIEEKELLGFGQLQMKI